MTTLASSEQERQRNEMAQGRAGWVEVIAGCMYSGKTEELIRRLRRVTLAKQRVLLVKPAIDDRYSETQVVSHSDDRMDAISLPGSSSGAIFSRWVELGRPPVVGIDEGQFFQNLSEITEKLASGGARVIVAGLDLDYEGKPFLEPALLSIAENVTKLTAVCMTCGRPASRTQRLSGGTDRVEIGAKDRYEARCRLHWTGKTTG